MRESRRTQQEQEHSANMKKLQKKLLDSQMNQIHEIRRLEKTIRDAPVIEGNKGYPPNNEPTKEE